MIHSNFVKWAGIYNLLLGVGMFFPFMTQMMGLHIPSYSMGTIVGVLLLYTAVVQIEFSKNINQYAKLIFWEGLLRWSAAALLVRYGFFGELGIMAGALGFIDFFIGIIFIIFIPKKLGCSRLDLLLLK